MFILVWWGFPLWTTKPLVLPVIPKQELVRSRPSPRWWLLHVAARLSEVWQGEETVEPAQGFGGSASCTFPGPLELLCKDALGHAQVCPVIIASAVCAGSLYPQVCVKKGKYLQSDAQHTILTCIFLLKWLKSRTCIRIPWSCDKFWGLGCTPDEQCELRYPYSLSVPPLFWSRARTEKHCFKANFYFLCSTQVPLFPVFRLSTHSLNPLAFLECPL